MNTFDTLQALFFHDLRELHQLQKRGWRVLPMTRVVKEEHSLPFSSVGPGTRRSFEIERKL
jgi:hypothetical protein